MLRGFPAPPHQPLRPGPLTPCPGRGLPKATSTTTNPVGARRGAAFLMPDPALLLALDTSTRWASVALSRGPTLLAEYTWQAGTNHTRQLLPVIKAVLQENQARLGDVGVVAVASGPGSFNGLRVGMATAKAFARTLGAPLVAVGTLEVEAYPHAAFPGPICPVHDAGRGELAWAMYTAEPPVSASPRLAIHDTPAPPPAPVPPVSPAAPVIPSASASPRVDSAKDLEGGWGWRCLSPPQITKAPDLSAAVKMPTLLCGEPPEWAMEHLTFQFVVAGPAASIRHGSALAELAWHRHQSGEHADVANLAPLYLRRPPGEPK